MKRQIPGLAETAPDSHSEVPDGIFLVRLESAQHRWQARKRFYLLWLSVLEPSRSPDAPLSVVSTAPQKRCGSWAGSCGIFCMTLNCCAPRRGRRTLHGLVGVVKISHTVVNGISLVNFDGFAPTRQWEELSTAAPHPRCG